MKYLLLILLALGLLTSACGNSGSNQTVKSLSCSGIDSNGTNYSYQLEYRNGLASVTAKVNDVYQQLHILEASENYSTAKIYIHFNEYTDTQTTYKFQNNVGMINESGQFITEPTSFVLFYSDKATDTVEQKLNLTVTCN